MNVKVEIPRKEITSIDKKKWDELRSNYYKVRLFYKMELPVLSEWLAVRVDGETDEINDDQESGLTVGRIK